MIEHEIRIIPTKINWIANILNCPCPNGIGYTPKEALDALYSSFKFWSNSENKEYQEWKESLLTMNS